MSPRQTRQIRTSLLKKGFAEDDTHHHYFWLMVDGKRTSIRTHYSQGEKECADWHQGQMAKQLKLSRKEFDDLINCPLQRETFIKL
jgi:hypothetical protein